ncbi:hypothetical protein BRD00_07215 [Halobacteriales archaeon QS_8_69_26]|nr:MAG: hypothetical protein BRD00_07215 [Halobacteriales archaeon QS_8_69_26]
MAAIDVRGVTERYGDVTALRSLDLSVEEGEIYGFPIVRLVVYAVNGFESPSTNPEWATVLLTVNPTTAVRTAIHGWIPSLFRATFGGPPGSGESAFYQDPAFGAVVLVVWGVLVPVVGYLRFRRADL